MKRMSFFILGLFLATATALSTPDIKWITTTHNFGAFDEDDGPVSCTFKFVNTGSEPVTVLSGRASCGCTRPSYPREAIAPGDTADITVTYDPTGRPGRFSKSVYVETDASDTRSRLTIEGVVIGAKSSVAARYPVDAGALKLRNNAILFGQVDRPHIKTVFTDAYNRSSENLEMRVVSKPRYIDISFEPKIVPPGEHTTIVSYMRSGETNLYGLVQDTIRLSAGKNVFEMPIAAIVNEDFSQLTDSQRANAPDAYIAQQSADFGRLSRAENPKEIEIEIENRGIDPLLIRRVYTADQGVSAGIDKTELHHGQKATISISVNPAEITADLLNARVSIITNDPNKSVQIIRVVGQIF